MKTIMAHVLCQGTDAKSIYGVSHCIVSKTRTYLFFIPDNGDILFYYIDRYNVRGFTREIHFGISHVRYQYFP
jgi:hypothetical protein